MSTMDEAAMEAASDDDRLWFDARPRRRHRIRPLIPGELPLCGIPGEGRWIIVTRNIRPGVRVRLPLHVRRLPPDHEDIAETLFQAGFGADCP